MIIEGSLPSADLPLWITPQGQMLHQKDAILRFLGQKLGYYNLKANLSDESESHQSNQTLLMQSYEVDWALETLRDTWHISFLKPWLASQVTATEIEARVSQLNKFNELFERKLESDGRKWLAGDSITIADFAVGSAYHSLILNEHIKHTDLKKAVLKTLEGKTSLNRWL